MRQYHKTDIAKLAHHRLVARALKRNPGLLDEAREVVHGWKSKPIHSHYVEEWEQLLSQSVDEVRRQIIRRSPELERLRASSPFVATRTQIVNGHQMKRLWRIADRLATAHRKTFTERSERSARIFG